MEPPSEKECVLINELRNRLKDVEVPEEELSDKELVRWIRARVNNVDNAELMFRNSVIWRQEFDTKSLLTYQPDLELLKRFPFTICGMDYEGCPVVLVQAGRMDFRTAFEEGYLEEGLKYIFSRLEMGLFLIRKLSVDQKFLRQITAIVDLEGLQLRQLTSIKLIGEFIKGLGVYEANYPETLRTAVVVNAPYIFAIAYRILVSVLTTRTLSKIQVHNYSVSKYSKEIQKIMAPEEFPEKYGGSGLITANLIEKFTEEHLNNDNSIFPAHYRVPDLPIETKETLLAFAKTQKISSAIPQSASISSN